MSETSALWDNVAEMDYTSHDISMAEKNLALEIAACFNDIGMSAPADIIELGSGSGKISSVLAELGYNTSLMDFSEVALEKSKSFFQAKQLPGEFILGDIFNAKTQLNRSYDITWNSGVMEHFNANELQALFKSVYSVTKKFYVCIVPNPESLPYLLFRFKSMKTGHWLYGLEFLRDDYEKIAETVGFKLIKTHPMGMALTQQYMAYAFGQEAGKLYQEFIDNGLAPSKESYLLMYVFSVEDGHDNISQITQSSCEIKTVTFDYMSTLLRTNTIISRQLDEQEKKYRSLQEAAAQEKTVLLEQIKTHEKRFTRLKTIASSLGVMRFLIHQKKRLHQLVTYIKTKTQSIIVLLKKYGFIACCQIVYRECRNAGFFNTLSYLQSKLTTKESLTIESDHLEENFPCAIAPNISFNDIVALLKQLQHHHVIQGIIFIDTAFNFDTMRNQRTIALAKAFASLGYFVVFIRYQWSKNDHSKQDFKLFHDRIVQIPRFGVKHLLVNNQFKVMPLPKYFIATIPDQQLLAIYLSLRENEFKVIYDILDDWEQFHAHQAAPWYQHDTEHFFINNADVVSVVSPALQHKFQVLRPIQLVTNGLFNRAAFLPRIVKKNCYHVGYFGHLTDKWFNWELLFKLAEDERFVIHLIGEGAPARLLKKLTQHANVTYHGYVPQASLAAIVELFDVGIIPFKRSKLSMAVDPLKVYEYLHYGRPVVSSGIPHLSTYPYCYDVSDDEAFKLAIIEAIDNVTVDFATVDHFLSENTWIKKCHELLLTENVIPS